MNKLMLERGLRLLVIFGLIALFALISKYENQISRWFRDTRGYLKIWWQYQRGVFTREPMNQKGWYALKRRYDFFREHNVRKHERELIRNILNESRVYRTKFTGKNNHKIKVKPMKMPIVE